MVPSIAIDNDGTVWFGTAGGVSHFDGSNWTTYTKYDGLVSDMVVSMAIDTAGVKWFGAIEGGVSSFDGNNWTTFTAADGLASDCEVRCIAVDLENVKWFGSKWAGISKYVEGPTSVAENTKVPAVMDIRGNFPNPFNSSTIIEFNLNTEVFVKLYIYNISGQKINTLLAENLPAGAHSVRWDGRDSRGVEVSTGIYLVKLQIDKTIASHRMVLMK